MTRSVKVRLRVDPVACDAYGYWGYPMIDGTPVGPDLMALATRAAAECPRRAVHLDHVR
jgi:hypothetical protein